MTVTKLIEKYGNDIPSFEIHFKHFAIELLELVKEEGILLSDKIEDTPHWKPAYGTAIDKALEELRK